MPMEDVIENAKLNIPYYKKYYPLLWTLIRDLLAHIDEQEKKIEKIGGELADMRNEFSAQSDWS